MDWDDGANLYLLKAVNIYGKNWSLVSSALSAIASIYLKDENLKGFSDQSCSLQYKYLIASTRQTTDCINFLNEENLLKLAIRRYTDLRRARIKKRKHDLLNQIESSKNENQKLMEGQYSVLDDVAITNFRKRCRAFKFPDFIGESMGLEALPLNEEENSNVAKAVLSENVDNGLRHSTIDSLGGLWVPVNAESFATLFSEKETSYWNSGFVDPYHMYGDVTETNSPEACSSSFIPNLAKSESLAPCKEEETSQHSKSPYKRQATSEEGHRTHPKRATLESCLIPSSDVEQTKDTFSPASNTLSLEGTEPPEEGSPRIPISRPECTKLLSPHLHHPRPSKRPRPRFQASMEVDSISDYRETAFGFQASQSISSMGRRWRRGLLSALATACSHRHAHVFLQAVTEEIAPGYREVVGRPVDLTSLRRRVEASLACLAGTAAAAASEGGLSPRAGEAVIIKTARQLLRDLLLMFVNARMYNCRTHSVHRMAGEMFTDVFSELRPIWCVLAEDIADFPTLPGSPTPASSVLRRRTAGTLLQTTQTLPTQALSPSSVSTRQYTEKKTE